MANFSLGEAILGTGIDLKGLKEGFGQAESESQSGVSRIGDIFSTGLKVAAGAVVAAGLVIATGFGYAFGQALEGEQNLVRLEQVIQSTGGAAGVTSAEAQELAQQFKNLAGGSDDVILGIEEIALRAGSISEQQMPDFIQRTLDLGAVMGDTSAAATLLARAQEDPLAALTKLTRAGILFIAEQEEQVKALVEGGDSAGATALIMERLAEATGGAAAANAGTLAGQWEIFKGTLSETAETVGAAFLPLAHELFDNVITPAIPIVEALAKQLAEGVGPAFEATRGKIEEYLPVIQPVIDGALNIASAFGESMPMVQQTVGEMAAFVTDQFNTLSPTLIANVSSTLESIATFWREHGDTIMAVVKFAFEFITVTIGGALTLASGLVSAALQLINGDFSGAGETLKSTVTSFMNAVLSIVGTDLDSFTETWRGNWELAKTILSTACDAMVLAVSGFIENIKGDIQAGIDFITGAFELDWGAIGSGIISGIASGIAGAMGGLAQQAANAALAALEAAAEALGISSPSTVAAEMVGLPIGQGMAMGMLEAIPDIRAASATAALSSVFAPVDTFNIDARGSRASRTEIRAIVEQVLREAGRRGDNLGRLGAFV